MNNLFHFIKSPKFIFNTLTWILWCIFVWGACYSFVLFPWKPPTIEWWCIPHLFTIATSAAFLVYILCNIEKQIIENENKGE